MAAFSNSTTERLTGYGRARGLDGFGVLADRTNSAGVFFCVRLDGKTLTRWIALGWTRAEAEAAIDRLSAGNDLSPSHTGYTASVS